MRRVTSALILSGLWIQIVAQVPQFAVVRPNGTTQIFQSWASAYAAALDDDFVYLPGTGITGSIVINKRLHIFGAGHHPDSTSATSKTVFSGSISIYNGGSGGSLEGIAVNSTVNLGNNGTKISNYTIKRCYINSNLLFGSSEVDSLPEYINVTENVIYNIQGLVVPGPMNIVMERNLIRSQILNFEYCTFSNNDFLSPGIVFVNVNNSLLENNIFLYSNPVPGDINCFNSIFNNLKIAYADFEETPSCPILGETGNIFVESIDDIFISYNGSGDIYDDNYHLDPDCPGNNAGTDGTDVGIYGTNEPTPEGWVPSNPHIYFKDIAPSTDSDGRLHIQVGVRTEDD